MNTNLSKRVLTSFILLIILSLSLFLNKYIWLALLIAVSIISFNEFNTLLKKIIKKKNIINLINIITFLYLIFFVYSAYEVYNYPPVGLIFILLICIFSDTGGYIIGKIIGGKKLTHISPNKTISGSLGSFTFSLFPIIIYWMIFVFIGDDNFKIDNPEFAICVCLFLSLICQLGDLFISYFKRKANVKDTGVILPGHGGLLDRIDGSIFVLPVAYIIDKIFF